MSNWRTIYVQKKETLTIKVGMWLNDNMMYFTVEGLQPGDVIEQDFEFGMPTDKLEEIVAEAKKIQSTPAGEQDDNSKL